LIALLLVLATAGCGNGSGDSVLGKSFQSRALAICDRALAQKKAQGPFPYSDLNPTQPDREKLPAIARFEAKTVKIYRRWLRDMLALGQPPTGRAPWADLMTALKGHVRVIVEQQSAAQNGDTHTFTKDYADGNKVQNEMESAANAADVPLCSTAAAA
jgi:hypothetical protein